MRHWSPIPCPPWSCSGTPPFVSLLVSVAFLTFTSEQLTLAASQMYFSCFRCQVDWNYNKKPLHEQSNDPVTFPYHLYKLTLNWYLFLRGWETRPAVHIKNGKVSLSTQDVPRIACKLLGRSEKVPGGFVQWTDLTTSPNDSHIKNIQFPCLLGIWEPLHPNTTKCRTFHSKEIDLWID